MLSSQPSVLPVLQAVAGALPAASPPAGPTSAGLHGGALPQNEDLVLNTPSGLTSSPLP